ncbi:MAG: glycoside hydrolase family 2 TIM barrel-domain containing protein [Myxococcales bacterium]
MAAGDGRGATAGDAAADGVAAGDEDAAGGDAGVPSDAGQGGDGQVASAQAAGAAAVRIDGGRLLVDGEPFAIHGVCWNPVPRGGTHPADLDFAGFAQGDAPLMAAAGLNAVRTYDAITDVAVLDTLHAAGIHVLDTVYAWGGDDPSVVDARVNAVKDHPAILMWVLGNEWNYNGLYVGVSHQESLDALNAAAARIRALDDAHPIATVYGEIPSADTVDAMPLIDVWGINAYRGIGFGDLFESFAATSDKPMFLAEYGADAYDATQGGVNLEAQADATRALTLEIMAQAPAPAGGGQCLGGTIFEWADEWWKDGAGSPDQHDVGGIAPGGGPHPDQTFNEEWWGVVDIGRNPRPAYDALKALYAPP